MGAATMQRVRFPGDRQAVVEDAEIPQPRGDEVVVRVRASGLCGSDLHGLYRPPHGSPFTPGHEIAGEVIAVDRALVVRVGDRVAVHAATGCRGCRFCRRGAFIMCTRGETLGFGRDGGDATYVVTPERTCLPLPDDVPYDVAALLGDGVGTPYRALRKAGGVRGGQTLGIFGLGPIGLGATMLGAYYGASVIGIDTNAERLALARALGAAHTVDAGGDPISALRELTGGRGLDVAMECAGSAAAFEYALESIGAFGRIALVGEHHQASFDPSKHFLGRELAVTGTRYCHISDYDEILALIAGGLRPERMITHRFPLAEAPHAFRLFDGGHAAKVLLLP